MFAESSWRQHPAVTKAFTGLPAEVFWDLIEKIAEQLPTYEEQRLRRANCQRMIGGERDFDQPLVMRVGQELGHYCHPFSLRASDLPGHSVHGLRSGQCSNSALADRKGS